MPSLSYERLLNAASSGNFEKMTTLMAKLAAAGLVSRREVATKPHMHGLTLLMAIVAHRNYASGFGWPGCLAEVLRVAGGDVVWVRAQSRSGSSALHFLMDHCFAQDRAHLAAAIVLLCHGADARATDKVFLNARKDRAARGRPAEFEAPVITLLRLAESEGDGRRAVRIFFALCEAGNPEPPCWSVFERLPAVRAALAPPEKVLIGAWAEARRCRREGGASAGSDALRVWAAAPRACLAEVMLQLRRPPLPCGAAPVLRWPR